MQPNADKPSDLHTLPGEQLSGNGGETGPLGFGVPPLVEQAQKAFYRDLPRLLQERPGPWVAYHGDKPLGFARTQAELYRECLRRGIDEEEFVVQCIEPEVGVMVLLGSHGLD
jgi:hypothetical protein